MTRAALVQVATLDARALGRALAARRGHLGLSQLDVARRAGLSGGHVSMIEGGRGCRLATLARLIAALGGTLDVPEDGA